VGGQPEGDVRRQAAQPHRLREAIDHHQRALAIFGELGGRHDQVETLRDLGDALLAAGRPQQARQVWQEALALCEAMQIPEADEVRVRLGALPALASNPESAG
jgi:tetratricopeptide (TPR) repeat protein